MTDELDRRIAELDLAAARLKGGELQGDDAAALVERCAALATEIAAELDRLGREARSDPPAPDLPEQERLL